MAAMPFPKIMGVVNVTPDSFSDGGRFSSRRDAVDHALIMIDEGADVIDVGGESTRQGAMPVDVDVQLERVIPVIEGIRSIHPTIEISVDTAKAMVANEAVEAGATMINDVTAGLGDPLMFLCAASLRVPFIVMHMQGVPRTMQDEPTYVDVVTEVFDMLRERVLAAREAGIREVWVDVGIGFGKTLEHNLTLLRNLATFNDLGPQVVGISRKRFLGSITGIDEPEQRDTATALMHALLLQHQARMVRVHNVKMIAELRKLYEALNL